MVTTQPVSTFSFSGVVPSLAQVSDLGPPRSECGVGCLMPWAGKLYVLNYNSHKEKSGRGVSLWWTKRLVYVPSTPSVSSTTTATRS